MIDGSDSLPDYIRICQNNSAGTTRDVLAPAEAKEGNVSSGAKRPTPVFHSHCLSDVFDHKHSFVLAEALDAIHVGRQPEQMGGDHTEGLRIN